MKTWTLIRIAVILAALASLSQAWAMNLRHYDLESLAYFSTDIVIARISIDGKSNASATVLEPLSGSLKPGDSITDLYPFLTFFTPLPNGAKVVLFLDDRSRPRSIFDDVNRAKYAVPPSGVYLIDQYGHVHEYFQWGNPGPYIAEGYGHGFPEPLKSPTRKEDMTYPSLNQVKAKILAAVARVAPIRARLDKPTTRKDIPFLLHLVDWTSRDGSDCDLRKASAIAERAMQKIEALNDPGVLLRADTLAAGSDAMAPEIDFIEKSDIRNPTFTRNRLNYLLHIVRNRKANVAERRMAATLLVRLSGWGSSSRGIHNSFLNSAAGQILATSKHVFDDRTDDPQLRALCLHFIDLTMPANVADVRRVYRTTPSDELRFAIEKAFANTSGKLYASLHAPGGPVASRVSIPRLCGCAKAYPGKLQILEEYKEPRAWVATLRHSNFYVEGARPMMINTKTGTATKIEGMKTIGGGYGYSQGRLEFVFPQATDLPPGRYRIALRVPGKNGTRTGYGVAVTVRKTAAGNRIDVRQRAAD